MKRNSILFLFLLCSVFCRAQQLSPEQTGGVYYAYPVNSSQRVDIPDGFGVFYISHYGRHGSRWLPDEGRYEWVNEQFSDDSNLTRLGRDVKRRLKKIWKNARGHAGQLTPLGARQHQGIARRMAEHYPEVFRGDDTRLQARSSTVPRCRASMLSFCEELQQHFPQLHIIPETDAAHMAYLNHESAELKALQRRTRRQPNIGTDRFMSALFKDVTKVRDPRKLLSELHTIASDMQDIPLNVSLWDLFTHEELMAVHDANNERMTICNGTTPLNEGIPARSSIALWQNVEQEADAIIANGGHGASLRFGHDTALYRLLTLLQLQLPGNSMSAFLCMGANLQLVFARNAEGTVLVQFVLNEKAAKLAIPSHYGDCYEWSSVKAYMHDRIHRLEHLRQLSALNTMVGTAPANTRTAGLFGKGSEEHGQTLPAVLVPNGQTFWTPQTRDTEKKCVAPFYYTDSLLQGFRASHWLVGGCTQDYGSFTVAPLGGELRLTAEERATRFSHSHETSHPYYYAVDLPDEHMRAELTGLSHAAALRITPTADGPVHLVVNHNSDEGEGSVVVDTISKVVYLQNPVHRIYQGWGERAGFSGHLVLMYTDEIAGFCKFEQGVALTFKGRRGVPMTFRMATSFTSREGALSNLQAEGADFESMMQQNIDAWTARLHTIDVEDPDTARVNQFYGALYRASFLPREMSDADGSRPRFADGTTIVSKKPGYRKSYGDFSMWDTYRALHPLYNIIAPAESADMMQSLVDMYEEGGWLPIFPCWNSYTAAMIGDHCSSVLADAYVKGIRSFDAEKAYEGMLKNAMESPKTPGEYKNGMGRRALQSYLTYGYIPLEDSVMEAFHTKEQTSRTLEYAYDDFCVAQMAKALGHDDDYRQLMGRADNWRNVVNPLTGYADGRHADGRWEQNTDIVHRQPYITEGATCHYTWYVPHKMDDFIEYLGGSEPFTAKLDSMFTEGRYWHGNEPCHQVAWLFGMAGHPEKTRHWVRHILDTEYNDTPGGLSGNDDAGQMSAWQVFAMMGFYPVCPATTRYELASPVFKRVTINRPDAQPFVIEGTGSEQVRTILLNGRPLNRSFLDHSDLTNGGTLLFSDKTGD